MTAAAATSRSFASAIAPISIVPAYRTLYADQPATLQSILPGKPGGAVTWSLLSQPRGGDGHLLDADRRDTVFSATVAGRYTLLATSVADVTQTATATLYVTGHALPYSATALGTEPVDCTVDPSLTGTTYNVGPSQTYQHLRDLPLAGLGAGSTVRLHNEDTSGQNPTTYHEYLQLSERATADQPLRFCGVPDSTGHLPVLDATAATAAGLASATPAAILSVAASANIQIEGLALRNANAAVTYQAIDGTQARWASDVGCLSITAGQNITVLGNDLGHCSTGGHSATAGSTTALNTLWEGNHLHDNGVVGSAIGHQLSLEAAGEIIQFNQLDSYPAGALGANIRSRSLGDIIRYNYLGGSPARQIDLEAISGATAPSTGRSAKPAVKLVADPQADPQAAATHLVYGNYYQNSR